MTIVSSDKKQRLEISTINTHLFLFHECGIEFTTQKKRSVTFQWWNPATWGGYEWVNSNNVLQPAITSVKFFMGNGTERNPMDFNPTSSRSTGHFKSSAVSVNPSGPQGNDVSWITRVTMSFDYEDKTFNI